MDEKALDNLREEIRQGRLDAEHLLSVIGSLNRRLLAALRRIEDRPIRRAAHGRPSSMLPLGVGSPAIAAAARIGGGHDPGPMGRRVGGTRPALPSLTSAVEIPRIGRACRWSGRCGSSCPSGSRKDNGLAVIPDRPYTPHPACPLPDARLESCEMPLSLVVLSNHDRPYRGGVGGFSSPSCCSGRRLDGVAIPPAR